MDTQNTAIKREMQRYLQVVLEIRQDYRLKLQDEYHRHADKIADIQRSIAGERVPGLCPNCERDYRSFHQWDDLTECPRCGAEVGGGEYVGIDPLECCGQDAYEAMCEQTTRVEITTGGQQLWERFKGFLSQACPDCEFKLAPRLETRGHELRVTRQFGNGTYALDTAIGACLFDLAQQIQERFQEGRVLFASPTEWSWCSKHQFVEEPVRFFLEKSSGMWFVNMATVVESGEE